MTHDHSTLDEQMQAYLDGTASEADLQAVAEAVRNDPAAASLLARHTLLRELLEDHYADGNDLASLHPAPVVTNQPGRVAGRHQPGRMTGRLQPGWLAATTATAALLVVIAFGWGGWLPKAADDAKPAVPTVAVVARHTPALQWEAASAGAPVRGTSLPAGPVKIRKGSLSLLLSSGVELTVDGPAEFDLQSDMQVLLAAGHMHAVVPEGAEGFVIEAAGLRVVDLGTEFEVTMPADGRPLVAVSRGAVETSFANSPTRMRIGEAERHRFDPATRTSKPLGTLSDAVAMNLQAFGQPAPAPRATTSHNPADDASLTTTLQSETLSIAADTFISLDHAQEKERLQLGEPGGNAGLTILPDGSLTVEHVQVAGRSRLHLAGGMLTLGDSQAQANLCLTPDTHLDLVIDSGYLITENVVRLATGQETTVDMQINGGLVEARRPFVLCEFGGGRLLQTGGQFRVADNLFLHSRHAKQPVRYTIRGGTLTGPGSLRLADGQATDAIFRVEGTEPTIQLGRLIMASDCGGLEFLIDTSGVSPIVVDEELNLNKQETLKQGTLRLFAAAGDEPLPDHVVLLRYRNRLGQFARVELDGLTGTVVYDDTAGEVRLENIKRQAGD
jgi:hypothetical protein